MWRVSTQVRLLVPNSYEFGENEDAGGAELTISGNSFSELSIQGSCWHGDSCGEFYAKIGLVCHDKVVKFKKDNKAFSKSTKQRAVEYMLLRLGKQEATERRFMGSIRED